MATLGQLVRRTADELFVDREAELGELVTWLQDHAPGRPLVMAVHGPGGVGKSTLLNRVEAEAASLGYATTRLDGRDFEPSLQGLLGALCVLDVNQLSAHLAEHPALLVIDAFEYVERLAPVLQRAVLPLLPDTTKVLIGGRRRLDATAWREWLPHIHSVTLGPLPSRPARELLARRGITDRARQMAIVRATRGLPLALVIAADARSTREMPHQGRDAADWHPVLRELVDELVAEVDDPEVRAAVEAAAVVRRFDYELLAAITGTRLSADAFSEVTGLSFVSAEAGAYTVHEEVRSVLTAALSARAPQRFADYVRRASDAYDQRLRATTDARVREQLLVDGIALHRLRPLFPSPADTAAVRVELAHPHDLGAIHQILHEFKTKRRQAAAAMSLDETDPAFIARVLSSRDGELAVARNANGVIRGYAFVLALNKRSMQLLPRHGDLRPALALWLGETFVRETTGGSGTYFMSSIVYGLDDGEAAQDALREHGLKTCLRGGQYIAVTSNPIFRALLDAGGAHLVGSFERAGSSTQPLETWVLNVDEYGAEDWMGALMAGRRPIRRVQLDALEEAVRHAFANWHDDPALAASPLMRFVSNPGQPQELRAHLQAAMKRAASDPRTAVQMQAIEAAYVRRRASIELAADDLHVSRATLFRLLRRGASSVARELDRRSPRR